MAHHTKDKGDIAAAKAVADLTMNGYTVYLPAVSEHMPFDMIAYKDGVFNRIQAKYSSNGDANVKTTYADKHGNHTKRYAETDFDYYALYLPALDKIVYPSIRFGGARIASEIPNSATPFYWWEDFISFTDNAYKRHYRDFGVELTHSSDKAVAADIKRRKVVRPSKDELEKLLWKKPITKIANDFGVSHSAIGKWAKSYGLSKPPRGYWMKQK